MAFYELLNPILNPLLNLGPFMAILIISIFVSILTTIIYKYTTNQKQLKHLKTETKNYQEKLKTLKDNPEKALQVQQEMMKLNMEYMKASFKPMFYTMIPMLLFLGWLGASLAFVPLAPNVDFSLNLTLNENAEISLIIPETITMNDVITKTSENNLISWQNIQGIEGEHEFKLVNKDTSEEKFFTLKISKTQIASNPIILLNSPSFNKIITNQQKLLIFKEIPILGNLPWIKTFGWLGTYILFSLIFSTVIRKWLKVF